MTFYVGQKVVCVGGKYRGDIPRPDAEANGAIYPRRGNIYTIRTINVWPGKTLVTLHECNNAHLVKIFGGGIEPGFNARGFRPVVDRKTDISIFTKMLNPKKAKETV